MHGIISLLFIRDGIKDVLVLTLIHWAFKGAGLCDHIPEEVFPLGMLDGAK